MTSKIAGLASAEPHVASTFAAPNGKRDARKPRAPRALIVFAHPERASFNGAMLNEGMAALSEAGCAVAVSDLYAMGFDPVSDREIFAR